MLQKDEEKFGVPWICVTDSGGPIEVKSGSN